MRPRSSCLAVLVLLPALLAAACGSEGSDGELTTDERAYADAFAADFADESDGLGVSTKEGDCLAEVVMAEVGTEPFEEADVTPEDLSGDETPGELLGEGAISEDQADAIYTSWEDCVDINDVFVDGLQKEYEADAAGRECIRSGLVEDDLMRAYMIASFTSGEPLDPSESPLKEIVALVTDCTASSADGGGGVLVDSIAESLAASGSLTPDEAQCLAQSIVDTVGTDELLQGASDGDFSNASPELQQAIVQAITGAAAACDVPLAKLGG